MLEGMIEESRHVRQDVVRGDLSPAKSEFYFDGDVTITGNIRDGVYLCANGKVEVQGIIEAAIIRAHGDIIVHGGLPGKAYLDSGGSVIVHYANNSSIVSSSTIYIRTGATHCNLTADNEVILDPEKGLLSGGTIRAGGLVSAATIGSIYKTETVIEVGITPIFRAENKRVADRIDMLRKEMDELQKVFHLLVNTDPRSMTRRQKEMLENLPLVQMKMTYLSKEISKYYRIYQSLQEAIQEDESSGMVRVFKSVYPGTTIFINFARMDILDIMNGTLFVQKGGGIQCQDI